MVIVKQGILQNKAACLQNRLTLMARGAAALTEASNTQMIEHSGSEPWHCGSHNCHLQTKTLLCCQIKLHHY